MSNNVLIRFLRGKKRKVKKNLLMLINIVMSAISLSYRNLPCLSMNKSIAGGAMKTPKRKDFFKADCKEFTGRGWSRIACSILCWWSLSQFWRELTEYWEVSRSKKNSSEKWGHIWAYCAWRLLICLCRRVFVTDSPQEEVWCSWVSKTWWVTHRGKIFLDNNTLFNYVTM